MNARERVFRTLKHEVPNRIPLDGWFLNSVLDRLIDHFGVTDIEGVLENLGIDFRTTCMEPKESIRDQFTYFSKLGLSIMIDDYFVRESGENEVEDEWGVKIKITGKDDTDWRYSYHPLNNEGELSLDNLQLPDLDSAGRFDRVKQDVSRWKGKYIVAAGVSTLFRKGWILSGYTRFLEALYLDRGFIEQLLDILMEFYTNQVAHYIAAGVDIIQFGGDLGTEESLMISPQMWRELFKPRLKQIIDSNRKKGIYFYLHSDGNIQSIIPDLIEIGFNILNPIQPECMDPRVIKERYGEKLTLHGTMSLQETFSLGKTEDVKVEVLDRLKYCGYNGGLILSPSNAFTDDIPMENILYFYKLVQETRM